LRIGRIVNRNVDATFIAVEHLYFAIPFLKA